MKISTKPISSPSRTDKFPPPLMRFLRSSAGSRSRGRSRSSPMFIRKKNQAIEVTQEPSSPTVTCIGQVRVRRSSKKNSSNSSGGRGGRGRGPFSCWWVKKTLFCCHFSKRFPPTSFRSSRRRWGLLARFGYCRRAEIRKDLPEIEAANCRDGDARFEDDGKQEEEEDEVPAKEEAPEASTSAFPPRNALLLTRCRSAPYRSSYLATQFWESPLPTSESSETGERKIENEALQDRETDAGESEKPTLEKEPSNRNSTLQSRIDRENNEDSEIPTELEGSTGDRAQEEWNAQKTGEEKVGPVHPLRLTRCKSEPARTGERLNPEASLWRQRRLGFAEHCSPRVCDLIN